VVAVHDQSSGGARWFADVLLTGCVLLVALTAVTGCGRRTLEPRPPFHPPTKESTATAKVLITRLNAAMNARDARAICRLYLYPGRRCRSVWRQRLDRIRLPVALSVRKVVIGCGDRRVEISPRGVHQVTTLTYLPYFREFPHRILDVGIGNRPSSITVPRHGGCEDPDYVRYDWGGTGRCDAAEEWGRDPALGLCPAKPD
jgi:hypothetical protein